MATLLQRVGRALRLVQPDQVDPAAPKQVTLHVEPTGTSGTEIYAGYFSEEYLQKLRGTPAADLWDQMRRSDPKIKMVLSAVKNPILGAHWTVQPGMEGDEFKKQAELIEQILFKDLDQSWTQTLREMLTHLDFGYSLFEVLHKPVIGNKRFGNYNSLSKLAFRSQRTIERWNLDPTNGKLISISQYAYGDLQKTVDIPAEFLLMFVNEKEGDNYEGVSALRPCYGPWYRKKEYLRLMAIGIEKFAIPTPFMKVPAGKEASPEFARAKTVLQQYTSHQKQYILYPEGFDLDFKETTFDASKLRDAIDKENVEISHAFLENFLELGSSGTGSYALGTDLSDFFLMGIEHIANNICETINRELIPEMIKLNFGPQEAYPELKCTGIKDKPGKELAEIMKLLVEARIVTPDADLEKDSREKYGLPKKAETVALPAPSVTAPQTFSEGMKLSDVKTPKSLISVRSDELKLKMRAGLQEIGEEVIADLMAKKKRATPSQYLAITTQVSPSGMADYKSMLKDFLAVVAGQAIGQARKEIPGGSKVKLVEVSKAHKLDEFSSLPVSIQRAITAQVGLLTQFQIQDLLKAVYFQFNSSVESTDSDALLESDLEGTLDKFLEGGSVAAGAGNTVSRTVNESRSAFFFDADVIEEIESFTFTNGDPQSPICQDLAGTVFSKDDPNMERYSPPLHHNCKSYLVANLKGSNKEINPTGLQPSKASLDKFITLAEPGTFVIQKIDVSKKSAATEEDAKRMAGDVTMLPLGVSSQTTEFAYSFTLLDPGQVEPGSLKSFEPIEGTTVFYGRMKKPLT